MKWVFWVSLSVIIYAYVGYPLWLWLRRLWRTRPVMSAPIGTSANLIAGGPSTGEPLMVVPEG